MLKLPDTCVRIAPATASCLWQLPVAFLACRARAGVSKKRFFTHRSCKELSWKSSVKNNVTKQTLLHLLLPWHSSVYRWLCPTRTATVTCSLADRSDIYKYLYIYNTDIYKAKLMAGGHGSAAFKIPPAMQVVHPEKILYSASRRR